MIYADHIDQLERSVLLQAAGLETDIRQLVNGHYGVRGWSLPHHRPKYVVPLGTKAPAWWLGDEEASQSFFAGVGVPPPA